jgi:hypothetical protein
VNLTPRPLYPYRKSDLLREQEKKYHSLPTAKLLYLLSYSGIHISTSRRQWETSTTMGRHPMAEMQPLSCKLISLKSRHPEIKKKIPVQAQRVPRGFACQISRQSAHEGGTVVSPTHRPPLSPRKYSWYSFLLEAGRVIFKKNSNDTIGIEPATFRLVAQCLKLRHWVALGSDAM